MSSPELKPEIQPMSHDQLLREAQHARLWENGRGIQYDILRRDDNTFDRIEFGRTEDDRLVFRVAIMSNDQWPTMREPTLSETLQFMDVARIAFPTSPLSIQLCDLIASQGEHMSELGRRFGSQLRIKAGLNTTSLYAGKK